MNKEETVEVKPEEKKTAAPKEVVRRPRLKTRIIPGRIESRGRQWEITVQCPVCMKAPDKYRCSVHGSGNTYEEKVYRCRYCGFDAVVLERKKFS